MSEAEFTDKKLVRDSIRSIQEVIANFKFPEIALIQDNTESADFYQKTVSALRDQINSGGHEFLPALIECLSNFSQFCSRQGELTEALALATEAISLAEEQVNLRSDRKSQFAATVVWNRISMIFDDIDDHERATAASLKAATIARQSFDFSNISDLINYGLILANLKNHALFTDTHLSMNVGLEAIDIMRKASIFNPVKYMPKLASVLSEHASTLHHINRFDQAEIYSREAVSVLKSLHLEHGIESPEILAIVYGNLSKILLSQNKAEEAFSVQEQVVNIRCGGLPYEEVEFPTAELAKSLTTMGRIILSNELLYQKMNAGYCFERSVDIWNQITRKDQRLYLRERAWSLYYLGVCVFTEFIFSEHERCYLALSYFRESLRLTEQLRENYHVQDNRDAHQLKSLDQYLGLVESCISLWEKNSDCSLLDESARILDKWKSRRLLELYFLEIPEVISDQLATDSSTGTGSNIDISPSEADSLPIASETKRFSSATERAAQSSRGNYLATLNNRLDQIDTCDTQSILIPKMRGGFSSDKIREPKECIPTDKITSLIMLAVLPLRTAALISRHAKETFALLLPNLPVENCVIASNKWNSSYKDYRDVCLDQYAEDHEKLLAKKKWEYFLSDFLEYLSQQLVSPIWNSIGISNNKDASETERLLIMPHGPFQNYPLHACVAKDDQYLCDLAEIVIIPNASLVTELSCKPPSELTTFLVVSNTILNLPFSNWETAYLQGRYSLRSLAGANATIGSAMREIPLAKYFLFSGHAIIYPENPTESGLKFNDGILTLKIIAESKMFEHCELVFLNGCETALLDPSFTDDHFSLPSACLQAGAKCVISTLWTVDDIPASLLSFKFHELWDLGRGQKVGVALNNSIRWLRGQHSEPTSSGRALLEFFKASLDNSNVDATAKSNCLKEAQIIADLFPDSAPFEHPIHWGAYVVHGVAW